MDAEQIAALSAYMEATDNELKVCPHCETWLLSECMIGRGCPTPDGVNGARIRTILKGQTDGE